MKVVIIGSGQIFMNLIAGCIDAGCDIVGVFRYEKVRHPFIDRLIIDVFNPSKEYNYIKSHKLYEIKARSANSKAFKKEILRLNADIILVGTWGEKLKKSIINLPKIATVNVHPSLLPKYRGPNPYLHAIKHLETESGITFHLMDENFDTGAILLQKKIPIESEDTGAELRQKIAPLAREGASELLKNLDEEIIIPIAQDPKKASYFPQINEDEVMLDFSKSAKEVAAHIKAFHPWFKCYFQHNKEFLIPNPYKLEISDATSNLPQGNFVDKSYKYNSLTVVCGDGKLLKMSDLKLFGPMRFFTSQYIKNKVKITKS